MAVELGSLIDQGAQTVSERLALHRHMCLSARRWWDTPARIPPLVVLSYAAAQQRGPLDDNRQERRADQRRRAHATSCGRVSAPECHSLPGIRSSRNSTSRWVANTPQRQVSGAPRPAADRGWAHRTMGGQRSGRG